MFHLLPYSRGPLLQDTSWSGVHVRQVIGRAWRLGQTKVVTVYHLIAKGTTDVLMSTMARTKSEMLDAFTQQAQNEGEMPVGKGSILAVKNS